MELTKEELANALVILLDLTVEDGKELLKVRKNTLKSIFDGQKANALAYNEMVAKTLG